MTFKTVTVPPETKEAVLAWLQRRAAAGSRWCWPRTEFAPLQAEGGLVFVEKLAHRLVMGSELRAAEDWLQHSIVGMHVPTHQVERVLEFRSFFVSKSLQRRSNSRSSPRLLSS